MNVSRVTGQVAIDSTIVHRARRYEQRPGFITYVIAGARRGRERAR
ncbi:hypothetical protein [Vineibacter terrae]|nr:hypothetical protein [Vineibacter terrae]